MLFIVASLVFFFTFQSSLRSVGFCTSNRGKLVLGNPWRGDLFRTKHWERSNRMFVPVAWTTCEDAITYQYYTLTCTAGLKLRRNARENSER